MPDESKPIPHFAIALNNTWALLLIIADHEAPGRSFFFWIAVAVLAVGTVGLTPWGEKFR